MFHLRFVKFLRTAREHLQMASSVKQQINYRFNIKDGVISNSFNYLLENDKQNSSKSVQSFYKIGS